MHCLEDLVADMLDRHVEVRAKPPVTLDHLDQLLIDLVGGEIEQADPIIARMREHRFEKLGECSPFMPILSKVAEILSDQNHLKSPLRQERPKFLEHLGALLAP